LHELHKTGARKLHSATGEGKKMVPGAGIEPA
jgi:hypothetical protein